MRKVNLPGSFTVSIPIDFSQAPDENGLVSFGGMEVGGYQELQESKDNISSVIWSAVCLEKQMEKVISHYFFGEFSGPDSKRHLFERELLQSSSMQFNFKKSLINKICDQRDDVSGKLTSKLQGALKRVMESRNAFAHGTISYDAKKGVVLSFYSGTHKTLSLDEAFWCSLEDSFKLSEQLLKELIT